MSDTAIGAQPPQTIGPCVHPIRSETWPCSYPLPSHHPGTQQEPPLFQRRWQQHDDRAFEPAGPRCSSVLIHTQMILRTTWRRFEVKGRTSLGQRPCSTASAHSLLSSTSGLSI